jgi:hypothetical protein
LRKSAKNLRKIKIRGRQRIFLWFHKKCGYARGSWWFRDFFVDFLGSSRKSAKNLRKIKIRERSRIFEPKIRQFL